VARFCTDETDVSFYYELVDYWIEEADTFVLVTPFNTYGRFPEATDCGLTEEESDEALSDTYKVFLKQTEHAWHYIPEKRRKKYSSFEEFHKEIEEEREKILSVSKKSEDIMVRYSKIMSPRSLPSALWHIYSYQLHYAELKLEHAKIKKQTKKRDFLLELKNPENELLLRNHIRYRLSHAWYGTPGSSCLMIIHYFKCNGETKQWLKSKRGYSELCPFEDLAFYKGDECVMGMVTHEGLVL
jgi:hypothetical protein